MCVCVLQRIVDIRWFIFIILASKTSSALFMTAQVLNRIIYSDRTIINNPEKVSLS